VSESRTNLDVDVSSIDAFHAFADDQLASVPKAAPIGDTHAIKLSMFSTFRRGSMSLGISRGPLVKRTTLSPRAAVSRKHLGESGSEETS
jgi:hypothetical protein